MRLNPTSNFNPEMMTKQSVSSRTFNSGTMELLSNVLNIPIRYDYQNRDGDMLILSAAGKQKISREDLLTVAKQFQGNFDEKALAALPQTVKDFFAKYASESGKGINSVSSAQIPNAVKNFFKDHSLNDLPNMPFDQVPDEVNNYIREQVSGHNLKGISKGHYGTANPNVDLNDTARQLVNSLFVNASSRQPGLSGSIESPGISNQELYQKVTDALDQTFESLAKDLVNTPPEVKEDIRSIHSLAKQRINRWAAANGIQSAKEG